METRTIPYDLLRARLRAHYRAQRQIVDFHMPVKGGIVIDYRVRDQDGDAWRNLLPVGVYDKQYRAVLQDLVPILFPDERLAIATMVRHGAEVEITVEPTAAADESA